MKESEISRIIENLINLYSNYEYIHTDLLELIAHLFLIRNQYKELFEILGLYFNKSLKKFIFGFLSSRLNKEVKEGFLRNLSFFLLLSSQRSFELLKQFRSDLPFRFVRDHLRDYPTLTLEFFEFLRFNFSEFLKNQEFL